MTYNSHLPEYSGEPGAFGLRFINSDKSKTTFAWEAKSLDDFRHATRMMKRASRATICPIDPTRIGRLLSMLNHGGSGPRTGCVILAGKNDTVLGFALLLVRPDIGLELSWLHVEDANCNSGIVENLWDHAVRTQCDWGFRILHVGHCASLPTTTSHWRR